MQVFKRTLLALLAVVNHRMVPILLAIQPEPPNIPAPE